MSIQNKYCRSVVLALIAIAIFALGMWFQACISSKEVENKETIYVDNSDSSIVSYESESGITNDQFPDSMVTAYIKNIEGNKITLDYIDVLTGKKAGDAKIVDGKCTQKEVDNFDCFPNGDIYYRNQNTQLRVLFLAPSVEVTTASNFAVSPTGVTQISISQLKKDYIDTFIASSHYLPYKITLNDKNEVISIVEIFVP